jgi:predicted acylesterase/phospholipase RssA
MDASFSLISKHKQKDSHSTFTHPSDFIAEITSKKKTTNQTSTSSDTKISLSQHNYKPRYKKLILAGGGLRGFAYIGAISALRKLDILDGFDEILGCSVGAVFALLIILNLTPEELHHHLLYFHYHQLKDVDFFRVLSDWGVESGTKIEQYLIELIERKTGLHNPTFSELFTKIKIGLIVNAVAVDEYKLYYFSHKTSPHMKIVKAVKASMSVPGLFAPVHYDGHIFVDGGLLNNFPIDYFKDSDRKSVLGICFNQEAKPPGLKNINSLNSYMSALMGCMVARISSLGEKDRKGKDKPQIISIETGDIAAFQATLDRTKRLYLYRKGEQAVLNALASSFSSSLSR